MLDYDALATLDVLIRTGSFNKAASALHLTQSAVSQRIRAFEERVGAPLVARTTPCSLTPLGHILLNHFGQVALLENELDIGLDSLQTSLPSFKIGVNADSVATWFLPAVLPLLTKRPWVISFLIENEFESFSLLQDGLVIGCVSTRASALPGCSLEPLGRMEYICLATKRFIRRYFPNGFTLENVLKAPAVIFNEKDGLHERFLKRVLRKKQIDFPRFELPSSEGFVEIIKGGAAYGLVPELQSRALVHKGALVKLGPEVPVYVPLFWHYPLREASPLKAFRKEFVAAGRGELFAEK